MYVYILFLFLFVMLILFSFSFRVKHIDTCNNSLVKDDNREGDTSCVIEEYVTLNDDAYDGVYTGGTNHNATLIAVWNLVCIKLCDEMMMTTSLTL